METRTAIVKWKAYKEPFMLTPSCLVMGMTECTVKFVVPSASGYFKGPATGIAYCSYKDEWDDIKGRKESLRRALDELGLMKAERHEIWEEFVNTYFIEGMTKREADYSRVLELKKKFPSREAVPQEAEPQEVIKDDLPF